MKKNIILTTLLFTFYLVNGQIGIGTTTPHTSSMLDISSSDKGLLIPRISLTGTNDNTTISSPATSLLVYNTNTSTPGPNQVTPGFYFWNGTDWVRFNTGVISGDNLGNHVASQNIELNGHYLSGDGDNEGVYVDNTGKVGIGFTGPFFSPLNLSGSGVYDATISSKNTTSGIEWRYGAITDGDFSVVKITGTTFQALTLEHATGNAMLSGDANRTFGLYRASSGDGKSLTIQAGGSQPLVTDAGGGNLILSSGISTGTGGSFIQFKTVTGGVSGNSDNSPTEKMRITSDGNLGIGTSTPAAQLHTTGTVRFTNYSSGSNGAILRTNTSGDLVVTNFSGLSNDVLRGDGTFGSVPGGGNNWGILGNSGTSPSTNFLGTTDNQSLMIRTDNTERVRITTKGNIEVLNSARSVYLGEGAGLTQDNSAVRFNIGIGNLSMGSITTGFNNVAVGSNAMFSNTIGNTNTALGASALYGNQTGSFNVALGASALPNSIAGSNNISIGYNSSLNSDNTNFNTVIGTSAYYSNIRGSAAVVIGAEAMYYANNTPFGFTNKNVAIGYRALRGSITAANNTGNDNTAVGYQSLLSNVTGSGNTAIGTQSLELNTYAGQNTAIGYFALRNQSFTNSNSNYLPANTAVGYMALANNNPTANNNGYLNTAVGSLALSSNTTGSGNVGVGYAAVQSATIANYNVGIGLWTLSSTTTGSNNVAIGSNALQSNQTGANNVSIGHASSQSSTGSSNTVLGSFASFNNTTGSSNVVIGSIAYETNIAGNSVVVIGTEAMRYANNTITSFTNQNIAIGYQALRGSITPAANFGNSNTVVGYQSLLNNTSGSNNVGLGSGSLSNNTSGSGNTAVGSSTLLSVTTGSNITAVGYLSASSPTLTNATAIGFRAMVQQNNSLVLGSINGVNGATANTDVGIGTTAPVSALHIRRSPSPPILTLQIGDQITIANTKLASIDFADATSGSATNQASIEVFRDAASSGSSDVPTAIVFNTTKDGSAAATESMRITNSGDVGIGVSSPVQKLDVFGTINSSAGYRVNNTAPAGTFLKGDGTAYVSGTILVSDIPSGSNAYIQNQIASDQNANFRITNTSNNTAIIRSTSTTSGSAALLVENTVTTTNATYAISATVASNNTSTAAIRGTATGTSADVTGVWGESSSAVTFSSGVYGRQTGAGQTYGVYGRNTGNGTFSAGVRGFSDATTAQAWGVQGVANSSNTLSAGVYGYHNHSSAAVSGVFGEVVSSNDNAAAVYGKAPITGFGGYFQGKGYFSENLGLGTTNPSVPLTLVRNAAFAEGHFLTYTGGTQYSALILGRARGTETTPAATLNNDVLGALVFRGHTGSAWITGASQIRCDASENYSGLNGGSRIVISTVLNGTTTATPRMTIDHNGNIAIGNFTPAYKLQLTHAQPANYVASIENNNNTSGANGVRVMAGQNTYTTPSLFIGFFRPDNTEIGSITQNTSTTVAYNTTSDSRLKNVISVSSFGLKQLNQIQVVDYTFKTDPDNQLMNGFLAQQLFEHYPFAVTKPQNENDIWQVDYGKLTPILVQSIQELSKENQELKNKLEQQTKLNEDLRKEFEEQKAEIQKIKEYLNLSTKND